MERYSMEGIDPVELAQPHNKVERIFTVIKRDSVTKEVIERLAVIDPVVILQNGELFPVNLEHIEKYVNGELSFVKKYYPDECDRPGSRKSVDKVFKIDRLFREKNYSQLIKIFLDESIKQWGIADRMDETKKQMSAEERKVGQEVYEKSVQTEKDISKREAATGQREEHGFPPRLLEVGGESYRQESRIFLAYAIVLAKIIKDNES